MLNVRNDSTPTGLCPRSEEVDEGGCTYGQLYEHGVRGHDLQKVKTYFGIDGLDPELRRSLYMQDCRVLLQ